MTKKERKSFLEAMELCAEQSDCEQAHANADEILCEMLTKLGYQDIVAAFEKVCKWYA